MYVDCELAVDAFKVVHPATAGSLTDNTATDGRYILACKQLAGVKTVKMTVTRPEELTAFGGEFGDGHWATLIAMVNNALAFYLIFALIKRAGPVFFSMVNYIATLVGIGVGVWFFGDGNSLWIWAALALIGAGLVLVNLAPTSDETKA